IEIGWLLLRTLMSSLGLSLATVHILLQILASIAVVIAAIVAARAGGMVAVLIAVPLASTAHISVAGLQLVPLFSDGTQHLAVFNVRLLAFLGSVLLLTGVAIAERPGPVPVVVAALVAAVISNVHAGCVTAGVSVVWLALLAPRRRWALVLLGAIV